MAQSMTIKTKMAVILATVILCSTLMMGWNAYSTYRSLLSQRQTELASLVDPFRHAPLPPRLERHGW